MSADAANLQCPICSHTGVFTSVLSLRDRLITVSTNKIPCPVCQEEVIGLDKLTIHLFSHVKLITKKDAPKSEINKIDTKIGEKTESQLQTHPKRSKTSASKNKSQASAPVKYVKIYPKLPVISTYTLPVIDISRGQPLEECAQSSNKSIYVPAVKTEAQLPQTNTTCNLCSLQFVDADILKMHRSLIHNIDEIPNVNSTRYHCHLCPKHFKMRGSLMVHLRVAHYGFNSLNSNASKNMNNVQSTSHLSNEKPITFERNDGKQWQCDVCHKCFTTKYFLKKHKRLHTGETPYACSQCNKTFTFQQSYHKHLVYHNDEKPHTCSFCGRAFKELSTLHNHERIHTGEKPFSCETCGKCFRQRVSYLVHRRIHTGVMPYKCTACEKSFRYKVSQRTHKCQVQPPGTVVRQTGELIEKLKIKNVHAETKPISSTNKDQGLVITTSSNENQNYVEVSEANAELARQGAKLSLEDMESENFILFNEPDDKVKLPNNENYNRSIDLFNTFDDIISTDNNVPSPSETLKKLCLSTDEDSLELSPSSTEASTLFNNLFL